MTDEASLDALAEDRADTFDHWDEAFVQDPLPIYTRMRSECPVAHSDLYGGFWAIASYKHIVEVCHEPGKFSSRAQSIPVDIGAGDMILPPINVDPPNHNAFRRMLLPFFSPQRVASLEPVVRDIVRTLLDAAYPSQDLDLCASFTERLPVLVTEELLGTSAADADKFASWISRLVEQGATNYEVASKAAQSMALYLSELMEARRHFPRDDLATFIACAEAPKDLDLGDNERLGCIMLLLIAGIDTTASALGSALWHCALVEDDWSWMRRDPTIIASAVEEFLRAFSPTTVTRTATVDVEVGSSLIRAGEPLLIMLPCANRDESEFPHADRVLLDRSPNRHLAFGLGIHRCLGSSLARMEIRVALEELTKRMESLSLARSAQIIWKKGPIRGPKNLPVRVLWDSRAAPGAKDPANGI